MFIKINGVVFEPVFWSFNEDGVWGKAYFLVEKGTYKIGSNNGAYATEKNFGEYFYGKQYKPGILKQIFNLDNFDKQSVYVAVDCAMDPENIIGKPIDCIFADLAEFIDDNLERKK